jgi:hypothetical protein
MTGIIENIEFGTGMLLGTSILIAINIGVLIMLAKDLKLTAMFGFFFNGLFAAFSYWRISEFASTSFDYTLPIAMSVFWFIICVLSIFIGDD